MDWSTADSDKYLEQAAHHGAWLVRAIEVRCLHHSLHDLLQDVVCCYGQGRAQQAAAHVNKHLELAARHRASDVRAIKVPLLHPACV